MSNDSTISGLSGGKSGSIFFPLPLNQQETVDAMRVYLQRNGALTDSMKRVISIEARLHVTGQERYAIAKAHPDECSQVDQIWWEMNVPGYKKRMIHTITESRLTLLGYGKYLALAALCIGIFRYRDKKISESIPLSKLLTSVAILTVGIPYFGIVDSAALIRDVGKLLFRSLVRNDIKNEKPIIFTDFTEPPRRVPLPTFQQTAVGVAGIIALYRLYDLWKKYKKYSEAHSEEINP